MSVSPTEEHEATPASTEDANSAADAHEADAATSSTDETSAADSSTADDKGGDEKGSVLDAVTKALDTDDKSGEEGDGEEGEAAESSPGSEASGEKDEDKTKSDDDEEEDLGDITDEELKRYKPRTRKRMQQLLGKVEEKDGELERLRPAAEAYDRIATFARDNSIDEQTVNNLITYPVLRRDKPEMALQMIEKEYHALLSETGKQLPDDLKQQVDHGYLTQQHAQELSERRAREQREKARAEQQQQTEQERAQAEQKKLVEDVQGALSEWEDSWSKSDPDYRVKRDEVHEQVELELARRAKNKSLPNSRDEAVQMVEQARKRVEERHKKLRPPKQESKHVSGGTSSSEAKPKPNSMLEVIEGVVG